MRSPLVKPLRTRSGVAAAIIAVMLAALMPALLRAADSQDGQRTDLKMLLMTDSSVPFTSLDSWKATLDQEGIPYDVFDANSQTLTYGMLADDGTKTAKYQAVIQVVGNIADTEFGYTYLTTTEVDALTQFETNYGIRQIVDNPWPNSPNHGLVAESSGSQDGNVGALTAAGKTLFPELKGPIPLPNDDPVVSEVYGYLATPQSGFTTLVSAAAPNASSPYLGTFTRANGIEEMVIMVTGNQYQRHSQLLRNGMIRWVTRGVHLGSSRTYFSAHIDDIFLPTTVWNKTLKCTPGNDDTATCPPGPGNSNVSLARMQTTDTAAALAWQNAHDIKFDMVYNGFGYGRNNDGDPVADPFGTDILAKKAEFRWINHTWSHEQLDLLSLGQLNEEIGLNKTFATTHQLPNYDPKELVTGEHSGLGSYVGFHAGANPMKPQMPAALAQNDITWVADDASAQPNQRSIPWPGGGTTLTVPRHPSNIYYNVATRTDQLDEYNWIYVTPAGGGNCTPVPGVTTCRDTPASWDDYTKSEANIMFGHLAGNDPRPHYMHQPNLMVDNAGQGIMYGADGEGVLDRLFADYNQYFDTSVAPITNPTMTEAGTTMRNQAAWTAGKNSVTAYIQNGKVTIQTSGSLAVPITGTTVGTVDKDARSGWQTVNGSATLDVTPVSAPTVSGSPVIGQTLTATAAKWGSGRSAIGGAWVRCDAAGANCVPIAGATALTYQVGASDLGKSVRYRETGLWTRGVGDSAQQVVPQVVPAVITPDATGGMAPGAVVTVAPLANWGGTTGGTSTKQWVICTSATDTTTCTPIAGVTGVTYTLVPGDVDKWVRHREAITVTSNDNGVTYSNALRVVATPITLTPTNPPVAPKCPTRPQFNSIIFKDGVTSFYYRPQPGQEIRGARRLGTAKLKALLDTPKGRSTLPRLEYTTATPVDARRLPWFARKIGPNRVVTAIMSDATSSAYSGVRLAYPPKKGTYAKLILPNGTVQTLRADCPKVTGYKTIYAQNIFVNRTSK